MQKEAAADTLRRSRFLCKQFEPLNDMIRHAEDNMGEGATMSKWGRNFVVFDKYTPDWEIIPGHTLKSLISKKTQNNYTQIDVKLLVLLRRIDEEYKAAVKKVPYRIKKSQGGIGHLERPIEVLTIYDPSSRSRDPKARVLYSEGAAMCIRIRPEEGKSRVGGALAINELVKALRRIAFFGTHNIYDDRVEIYAGPIIYNDMRRKKR